MRSSGSTPNRPPDGAIPLFLTIAGEDHPKACTGRRLLHSGAAREWRAGRPILLDPHAERPLSPADRAAAERSGILAVDCSWNRLNARGGYPEDARLERLARRRLPLLIAANPQHFGRLAELNTVEALAAALAVLGRTEEAAALLAPFRGGPGLLEVNADALASYQRCRDAASIQEAEQRWLGPEGGTGR